MKRILIAGADSYIGTSFEKYMEKFGDDYKIDTVDMIGGDWKKKSFAGYDCVFFVAGIAHRKETPQNAHLYYEVNRDLAICTALKAKRSGVGQFILLSSMSVYGTDTGVITKETVPVPKSHYGRSKLMADEKISQLEDDNFHVAILRPPMVYGKGCKGNFRTLTKIAKMSPVFPKVNNQRSMIYIDNLCAFVKMCVDGSFGGLYYPQNREYICTSGMIREIAKGLGKKIYFSRLLGLAVSVFGKYFSYTRKAFGSLIYKDTEQHDFTYADIDNHDSIRKCFCTADTQKKVLFSATVVREHINVFHVPFLKLFNEHGWQTAVAARNDYFEDPSACHIDFCDKFYDIPFERSPFSRNNLKAYRQLKCVIDKNDYDIIHCHTPVGAMLTRIAARSARKKGTKVIYTAHGFHFYKGAPLKNWLLYFPAEWLLSAFTDTLITINQEDYRIAKKTMLAKEVVFVPGVGIDTEKFLKKHSTRDELIKEFGIDENAFIIASVGELIERKNFKTLIHAVEQLKNKNIVCLICGRGDMENRLKKLVTDMGLENKIIFLGFRKDIKRILHGSDVFVFPSYQEGLPVALMEAMAAGLPIIASDIRGNTDLIKNNKSGYLVNADDFRSFSRKIGELIEDHERMSTMGHNAERDISRYSAENVIKQMEDIYFK